MKLKSIVKLVSFSREKFKVYSDGSRSVTGGIETCAIPEQLTIASNHSLWDLNINVLHALGSLVHSTR